jgi:hypothetical protein
MLELSPLVHAKKLFAKRNEYYLIIIWQLHIPSNAKVEKHTDLNSAAALPIWPLFCKVVQCRLTVATCRNIRCSCAPLKRSSFSILRYFIALSYINARGISFTRKASAPQETSDGLINICCVHIFLYVRDWRISHGTKLLAKIRGFVGTQDPLY